MVYFKSKEEIEILHQGGQILAKILDKIIEKVRPGVSTKYLEDLALSLISEVGGRPAFQDYDMGDGIFFPSALCVSINHEVVHGASLPDRVLKSGDIVGLDVGLEWPIQSLEDAKKNNRAYNQYSSGGGFYTDTCRTVAVGKVSSLANKLIRVSKEALEIGINQAVAGNSINDIGRAIENYVKKHGFGVVEDLVGHGVGYFAHEAPHVFNYEVEEDEPDNIILQPGMVIAIEPMINAGRHHVKIDKNSYTFISSDKSLSSHYEHSVAILESGNLILTKL